jgi:protein SCO1/2
MAYNLQRVQEAFKDNPFVTIVSHTVDTRHDSIPILKQYADNLGALPNKWYFLTGEQKQIYNLAKSGYKLPADEKDNASDFIHSPYFVVVDSSLTIRNYYDGTDTADVNRMIGHISLIMPRKPKAEIKIKAKSKEK